MLKNILRIMLIFSAIPIFFTSCILDREGQLQSYDWLVSDEGRGKWQKITSDSTFPLYLVIGSCCNTKRPEVCSPNLFGEDRLLQHFGYFDHATIDVANGSTDVFRSYNGKWEYRNISKTGTNNWQASPYHFLNNSNVSALDVRFVDFKGDCKTDVFATWGGKWRVSDDGTGPWRIINSSNVEVSDLRFGDFNNDGKTDVFGSWGGKWYVSWNGESPWEQINVSDVKVSELIIADFQGDGKADVLATWGGKWRVSDDGRSAWRIINTSNIKVSELRVGDFNADGKADVFATWGGKWYVSWGGETPWEQINVSSKTVPVLKFGDFDGDGTTDVFTIVETTF